MKNKKLLIVAFIAGAISLLSTSCQPEDPELEPSQEDTIWTDNSGNDSTNTGGGNNGGNNGNDSTGTGGNNGNTDSTNTGGGNTGGGNDSTNWGDSLGLYHQFKWNSN